MNALLYIRVSHEDQVKFGMSLEAQESDLRKYCEENNIVIKGVYSDEGISGGSIEKRKAFKKMIEISKEGDIILFTKLDRFSRNLLDANITVKELDKKNVSIKAIFEDDIDTTTADGKFIFNLKLSLAERERLKTSERIKDVNVYKIKNGFVVTGSLPVGYCVKNKRFAIVERDAQCIRDLFNYYEKCQSIHETTRWWNRDHPYIRTCTKTIRQRLTNIFYTGRHPSGLNDNYCPRIISDEQFYKVQELIKKNITVTNSGVIHLFTRLIKCPDCGNHLAAHKRTNKNTGTYYKCGVAKQTKRCPNRMCIAESKVESFLIEEMKKICSGEYSAILDVKNPSEENYDKEIKIIVDKIERLKELYIDGLYTKQQFDAHHSLLREELLELKAKNIGIVTNVEIKELKGLDFETLYHKLNRENKRIFWRKYIHYIKFNKDRSLEVVWR